MMRTTAAVAALMLAGIGAARADETVRPTARTIDLGSGVTMAPGADGSGARPGLGLVLRWIAGEHVHVTGAAGASVAVAGDDPETGVWATIVTVGGGVGLHASSGGWTGYAGARADWLKSIDGGGDASRDPDWFQSGVRGGPAVAVARQIGTAWGHPMALELSAGYFVHVLRRADTAVIQIVPPADALPPVDLDGVELGLSLVGTLFPDRPL